MEKLKSYIKEIVLFLVLLAIFANILSYYRSGELNKSDLIIPQELSLIDGSSFKYDETKPLVIHFWADWCPVCKVEAPNIQTISKDHQVLTIAVDSGEDQKIKEYLKKEGFDFKTVNDSDSKLAGYFNISVFPTTFIYDRDKKLIFSEVGYTSTFGLKLRIFWASL